MTAFIAGLSSNAYIKNCYCELDVIMESGQELKLTAGKEEGQAEQNEGDAISSAVNTAINEWYTLIIIKLTKSSKFNYKVKYHNYYNNYDYYHIHNENIIMIVLKDGAQWSL